MVLVTAFSQRELIEEASDAGVHGYVVKPFERHDLTPAIEVGLERFQVEEDLLEQVANARSASRPARSSIVRRAILMDRHGLSEQDAFDFIQKQAMTSRRSMREVAEDVLSGSLTPGS